MHYSLIFILLITSLLAKEKESCFTVQLLSKKNSVLNKKNLYEQNFESSCVRMEIGSSLTVRCGCYGTTGEAKEKLVKFKDEYEFAYVASTYKYRFDKKFEFSESKQIKDDSRHRVTNNQKQEDSGNDDELKLILQAFLYSGDVENAYKAAYMGYQKNPSSYYWNEKMAEISRWSGRIDESIGYMLFLYSMKGDEKLQDDLIQYGNSIYQYEDIKHLVVDKARKNPSDENIDAVIEIYSKIGSPEEAAIFLEDEYKKNSSRKKYLTKILAIYLETGDLVSAKKIVNIMKKEKLYSLKNTVLISSYYYLRGNMQEAYNNLLLTDDKNKKVNIEYNRLLSDISWYIQDYQTGAKASKRLMQQKKARLVDYERVIFVYRTSDSELVYAASKNAYNEYKITYLFYGYASSAIELKYFDGLQEAIEDIDRSDSPLKKDALYWIIKSKVYGHFNHQVLRREALETAILIDPENSQNRVTLFWFFMENNYDDELKKLLFAMSEDKNLNQAFYMALASAYLYLSDINKANFWAQKLINLKHPSIYNVDFKFLMANIYQLQNREDSYKKEMQEIVEILDNQIKETPSLKQKSNFLSNYLFATIAVVPAEEFQKNLKEAKPYLSKKNYDEINYSWAIVNRADEKSHLIYQQIDKKEVWLRFSNAILFQEHTNIENLLYLYLTSLPVGDASQSSNKDGQKALAQKITFDGLLGNDANQNLYIQHRDLSKDRADEFDSYAAYYSRNPLLQKFVKLKNRTYLPEAWNLLTEINYFENSIIDDEFLLYVPERTLSADVGVRKLFDRGSIEAHVGHHDAEESYVSYSFLANYRVSTDLVLNLGYEINRDALDTIQLMLAGKKDTTSAEIIWSLWHSASFSLLCEQNEFSSQDDILVGDGYYSRLSFLKLFRSGYPDWSMGVYIDIGTYDEKVGDHGVLDKIDNGLFPVLPEDFYNIGGTFSLGMQNARAYTRVWRPYMTFSPYYNGALEEYNYSFDVGYGGQLLHQDHLSVGATYSESVFGTGQSTFEIYLKYQFLYMHP